MSDGIAVILAIVAICCFVFYFTYRIAYNFGLKDGRAEPRTPSWSDRLNGMNELKKLMSKPGAVDEFLAVGEGAEVVIRSWSLIDNRAATLALIDAGKLKPNQLRCFGCCYAGRYVLKGNAEELA